MKQAILQVEQLRVVAQRGKQCFPLVHDVSFSISQGETLALIGESGSGKSMTASAVFGLMPSSVQIGGGRVFFRGEDVLTWPPARRRTLRGQEIGCVFQDYQGSFTPFLPIGKQLTEMIRSHRDLSVREAKQLAIEWLERVELPADRVYSSYPFQLSGGQLQRTALAAAMMLQPSLLIADEPTTALDVLSGECVLDLLSALQKETGCAVLLISHDLRHVMKRADTIAVMRDGTIVETQAAAVMRQHASHPYTQMLLQVSPALSGEEVV